MKQNLKSKLLAESAKGTSPKESTPMQQNTQGNWLDESAKSNLPQESTVCNKTHKAIN